MTSLHPPVSFEAARQLMVDGQLRPNKVQDAVLLDVMRSLPRERFLPPQLLSLAYSDRDVPLSQGRVLMAPLAVARLVQLLLPVAGERILVVGAGTGYAAAVLAGCGAQVVALESDESLCEIAAEAFAGLGLKIGLRQGVLAAGAAGLADWDAIFIQGAIDAVPEAIARQLKPGTGRLVTVIAGRAGDGVAIRAERPFAEGALAVVPAFDCATANLPGFQLLVEFQL